jgi:hypothetical protein
MVRRYLLAFASIACLAIPSLAHATARLINVVPTNGGCVSGPTGPTVQFWDIQPGKTYQLTISNVAECGNGGTAPTINVRVNSMGSGNTDAVATFVSPGVYTFSYTLPAGATCTLNIFYCTTPGDGSSGTFVIRNDGGAFQAHLRADTFGPGCTNPTPIIGPDCLTVPVRPQSWGQVKSYYRN